MQKYCTTTIFVAVIRETPDVGQVDGEADDGEQKVNLLVPGLAGLLVAGQRPHRWCRRLVIQRRRLSLVRLRTSPSSYNQLEVN